MALSAIKAGVDYLMTNDNDFHTDDSRTALERRGVQVMSVGTFLAKAMSWTSKELEAIRPREWSDLFSLSLVAMDAQQLYTTIPQRRGTCQGFCAQGKELVGIADLIVFLAAMTCCSQRTLACPINSASSAWLDRRRTSDACQADLLRPASPGSKPSCQVSLT